ncbi:MAG: NAD(P)-dependent oxidoreductase [Candidatus Dormibacteraeota bacterium]|nr:NAD(P)-dependent oxidoreductase [Candidatus Dormibacteraeota bacterium]
MAEQAETVGFVGLGAMGGPMAANLVRAGYEVVGVEPVESRRSEAAQAGVRLAGSVAEAARAATRILISIVRDADQTREVVRGAGGLLTAGRQGLVLICMSTLDPGSLQSLSRELGEAGVEVVDAPVSGGVSGAREGTLTVMLAGADATLAGVRPVLEAIGRNLFRVGDTPGMAQAAKLANQLMLAVNMLGITEGLRIATRHGVDEEQLMALLSVSTGGSWAVRNWDDVRAFWQSAEPGGTLEVILKDLRSTLREADQQRLSLPVTGLVNQLIRHVWDGGR